MKLFRQLVSITAMTFLALSLTMCSKSPNEPEEDVDAPALPPAESMQMDLSAFGGSLTGLAKPADPTTKLNFTNAVARVAFVNATVAATLASPVALFAAALSQPPTLERDGKFHWVYEVRVGPTVWKAELVGWKSTNINWQMYVSGNTGDLQLADFMWYDGWSSVDNIKGQWMFYDPSKPDASEKMMSIDWQVNSETDADLTFTNLWEGNENKGDVLKYLAKGTDRSIEYTDASENETWKIFWDAETTAGYLHVPGYNDGNPAYWDENHNDIEAP